MRVYNYLFATRTGTVLQYGTCVGLNLLVISKPKHTHNQKCIVLSATKLPTVTTAIVLRYYGATLLEITSRVLCTVYRSSMLMDRPAPNRSCRWSFGSVDVSVPRIELRGGERRDDVA